MQEWQSSLILHIAFFVSIISLICTIIYFIRVIRIRKEIVDAIAEMA